MSITIKEQFDSTGHQTGDPRTAVLRYTVDGTTSSVIARQTAEGEAPLTLDIGDGLEPLVRKGFRPRPIGDGLWQVVVNYGDRTPGRPPRPAGGALFTFSTGGGLEHITQSIRTISRHGTPDHGGLAGDYLGAIGVTSDDILGVDIQVPVYNFTEQYEIADNLVTAAYRRDLFLATGSVNNAVHGDFSEGELKFNGADGSQRSDGNWDFLFGFSALPNVDGIIIGDIGTDEAKGSPPISKQGWHHLWVRYQDEVDGDLITFIKRPISVHIEQVFRTTDFAKLTP